MNERITKAQAFESLIELACNQRNVDNIVTLTRFIEQQFDVPSSCDCECDCECICEDDLPFNESIGTE